MTKLIVPHSDKEFNGRGGVKSLISFYRLEGLLRYAGDLKPDESISGFEVDKSDIRFTIVKE